MESCVRDDSSNLISSVPSDDIFVTNGSESNRQEVFKDPSEDSAFVENRNLLKVVEHNINEEGEEPTYYSGGQNSEIKNENGSDSMDEDKKNVEQPPAKKMKISAKEAESLLTSIQDKDKESIALAKTPTELLTCFR